VIVLGFDSADSSVRPAEQVHRAPLKGQGEKDRADGAVAELVSGFAPQAEPTIVSSARDTRDLFK